LAVCGLSVACLSAWGLSSGNRLSEIRTRGVLDCGIWPDVRGFAAAEEHSFSGFDVDLCHAVAAAIFGDATKVKFVPVETVEQFNAHDDIDLVVRRLTWTLSREASTGLTFGPVTFYDGQGFLVPRDHKVTNALQLAGDRVCVINTEHHAETLSAYFTDHGRSTQLVLIENNQQAETALRGNRCGSYSADVSWLAAARADFANGLALYDILPQLISKEPLAPLMRSEDRELIRVVQWTVFTMIEAEELGVNSRNVARMKADSPRLRLFLIARPDAEVASGPGDWVRAVIAGVGNYGEVFDRNLGRGSMIQLERGPNRLWVDGGLLYAPPLDR
jgi:general L-amino acid transport system substrate-binding protein